MVLENQQQQTVITTASTSAPVNQGVITQQQPITTIHEAPVVEKIIEKKDVEIHRRDVVQEIHEQPIIEIERRQEVQYVGMEPIHNKIVQEPRYEQIGEQQVPQQIVQQQQQPVVPTTETSTTTRELPPIIETIVEQPVYKQVIIEQHQIPVQTVFTQQAPQQEYSATQVVTRQDQVVQTQDMSQVTTSHPDHIRRVQSGYGKTIWGLSIGGELFKMHKDKKLGISWEKFGYWNGHPGNFRFHDFSVIKKGYMYLIGLEDRQLYYMDPFTSHEGMIRPALNQGTILPRLQGVSAWGVGQAYLLAENGSIYILDNGAIRSVNGTLRSISCGSPGRSLFSKHGFECWGVGPDGMAKRWNGTDAWVDMKLPVKDISVGRDNSVFAIASDGQLIRWDDRSHQFTACRTKFKDQQMNQPMGFESLSVFKERNGVYCVDRHGNVYSMDV